MDIRKITVGTDYKEGMHYVVGQDVLRGSYKISTIMYDSEIGSYIIWIISANNETLRWKEFTSNMPISVEFNIDF